MYTEVDYEADCNGAPEVLKHIGGVFIDVMSACYPGTPGETLQETCIQEAHWVAAMLSKSSRLYRYAPSACLEAPNASATLSKLAEIPGCVGIRQILNHEPHWPRNGELGDLLDNEQWKKGYALLADFGFSFDLQLNPHQFAKAADHIQNHPNIPVIINHLGTPTLDDLTTKSNQYWDGMRKLAALPNVNIKISMLCYTDKDFDKSPVVLDAISHILSLFGDDRCCFATNFPVDRKDGWPACRLYPALLAIALKSGLTEEQQRKMFCANARRIYKADS